MKFAIVTLGCKVNQFESQAMEQLMVERGHTPVKLGEGCDAVIINSCAVTAESGRKSRQAVRHCRKAEPLAVIALGGCYAQTKAPELADLGADLLGGSGDRGKFISDLEAVYLNKSKMTTTDDPKTRRKFELLPGGSVEGRTRAVLKIEDGCQNFCTYCIIPYLRGPVRSMRLEDIRREAIKLKSDGYGEIVVTGIEISSYGRDLPGNTSLIDAIREISSAAPGVRTHLGSLEPRTAGRDFCAALSCIPLVCPHFHLSLQSGCDSVLRRMGRRYDTALFYESVLNLREFFPNCGITTDVIAGFPGETEEEHKKTLDFLEKCRFSAVHVFPYSRRPGTKASDMPGQVQNVEKHRRCREISALAAKMADNFRQEQTGRTLNVLFETYDGGLWHGHTENYLEAAAPGDNLRGMALPVQITGCNGNILCGEVTTPAV